MNNMIIENLTQENVLKLYEIYPELFKQTIDGYYCLCLAGGSISPFIFDESIKERLFEEKIELIRNNLFKKKYPMFSNIDEIVKKIKSGIKIYNKM